MIDPGRGSREFDLIVVGAGSGNSVIGPEFEAASVALIDDGDRFGGTCLNAGCIPTKMLVRVADVATDAREAGRLGLNATVDSVDWPRIRDRVFGRTDAISDSGLSFREGQSPTVTVFRATFRFADQHTLVGASGVRIRGTSIVIAAGSRPRSLAAGYHPDPAGHHPAGHHPAGLDPAIHDPAGHDPAIYDSDSIMRIERLPASLLIVGGGAVAVEFAHIFDALGVEITLVTRSASLLTATDRGVSAGFTAVADRRWSRHASDTVASIERVGNSLVCTLGSGIRVTTEAVLVALGRIPNTDTLAAASAGFDLHDDGRLVVDAEQRVLSGGAPVPAVFALGDVSSRWQLKHVANHEARVVKHNLLHPDAPVGGDPGPVPSAIFSHPQIAFFGMSEADAARSGRSVVVVTQKYADTAYGWALEDETGFCKLIVDRDSGQLLGAHILGPEASILIQPLIQAASRKTGIRGLARSQYWPHPAASEVVENALLKAESAL